MPAKVPVGHKGNSTKAANTPATVRGACGDTSQYLTRARSSMRERCASKPKRRAPSLSTTKGEDDSVEEPASTATATTAQAGAVAGDVTTKAVVASYVAVARDAGGTTNGPPHEPTAGAVRGGDAKAVVV